MNRVKRKIITWIVALSLFIVIIFSITSILNRLQYNMNNYSLYISVETDITADYSTIDKYKTTNGSHRDWFNFLKERQKLMDYMKENNLKIKPGLYHIKRCASFEEIIKILQFEKIE